jgi:hypothetical protein
MTTAGEGFARYKPSAGKGIGLIIEYGSHALASFAVSMPSVCVYSPRGLEVLPSQGWDRGVPMLRRRSGA